MEPDGLAHEGFLGRALTSKTNQGKELLEGFSLHRDKYGQPYYLVDTSKFNTEEMVAAIEKMQGGEIVKLKQFESGAVRSNEEAGSVKPVRYDLVSHIGLRRLGETYAEGAVKYDDNNWRKGIPNSNLLNHCLAHVFAYLGGDSSEDHLAHATWNLIAIMENEELRPHLNDLYFRKEKKDSE
jgi:hypothetical protein